MTEKATFSGTAPSAFQFMPPGESIICATVNGKPGRRRVFVDKSSAERLQKDLEGKVAAAQAGDKARPCGLFDHKSGPASFIPTRFYWDDERGVMCECEWTDAGKQAVEGRNYTYFSPCFRLAKDGRVMGLQDGVEVGSMVNNPAFETIEPIAASKADEPADDSEDVVNVNGGAVELPGRTQSAFSFNPRYTMNQNINNIIRKVKKAAEESDSVAAAVAAMPERVADAFEAVKAANPYDCNQHGHGYKMPHHGMQQGQKEGKPNKPGWSPRKDSRNVKSAEPEGMEDDDNAEDKRKQYEDELEKLRAACEHEQDKDKKAVLKKRLEEMEAANPYGCNQHGHGFKREHSGYGGGGQKTFDFGEKKKK